MEAEGSTNWPGEALWYARRQRCSPQANYVYAVDCAADVSYIESKDINFRRIGLPGCGG